MAEKENEPGISVGRQGTDGGGAVEDDFMPRQTPWSRETLDDKGGGPPAKRRSLETVIGPGPQIAPGACQDVAEHQAALHKGVKDKFQYQLTSFAPRNWKRAHETVGVRMVAPEGGEEGSTGMDPEEFRQAAEATVQRGLATVLAGHVPGTQPIIQDKEPYKLQITVCNPNLHSGHRCTRFTRPEDAASMVAEAVNILANARQSEEARRGEDADGGTDILLEETEFHVTRIYKNKRYGGRAKHQRIRTRRIIAIGRWLATKRSMLDPIQPSYHGKRMNKRYHSWCVPIAVVLGRYDCDREKESGNALRKFHHSTGKLRAAAEELLDAAGLEHEGPFSIGQLEQLHKAIGEEEYQINCYTNDGKPVYSFGTNLAKQINIFLDDYEEGEEGFEKEAEVGHCFLIRDMVAFMGKARTGNYTPQFCLHCKSNYYKEKAHRCVESSCGLCRDPVCKNTTTEKLWQNAVKCPTCDRHFWAEECLAVHKTHPAHCKNPRCEACGFFHEKGNKELCGLSWCSFCKLDLPFDHGCCMRKDKNAGSKKPMKRIYADLECVRVVETGKQIPNMLTVHLVMPDGKRLEPELFEGNDCIHQFINQVLEEEDSPYRDSYLIFHNMKGYDGHLFLEVLLGLGLGCKTLLRGQDILCLEIESVNVKLRDSLLYMPGTALAQFPKMFKLDPSLAKGFFAHSLNTPEQLEKPFFEEDGQRFPPKYHFEPEKMGKSQQAAFLKWWAEEDARFAADPELKYSVLEELRHYNAMDVELLLEGMESYLAGCRANFPDVDPLASITLPSYVNALFRNEAMVEGSISLLPPDGFCPEAKATSKKELAWLLWQEKQLGLTELRHNRNFRPINIAGFHVDGWGVDSKGQRYVLEFNGCHWHGCEEKGCRFKPVPKNEAAESKRISQRMQARVKKERLERIGARGDSPYGTFTYVEVWEHDFHRQLKEDSEMEAFMKTFDESINMEEPLSLREAFMGGRTEVFKHFGELDGKKEWGRYLDFTSLYPSVTACTEEGEQYPVGYPRILIANQIPDFLEEVGGLEQVFGMVHCILLPPRELRIPSVPCRITGKLLFVLCRTCAEEEHDGVCGHSEEERSLQVHITTPELHEALGLGYAVKRVDEVWHWAEEARSSELLRDFALELYLGKEYASGFPAHVKTPEQQKAHADYVSKTLGSIAVDPGLFDANPGLRQALKFKNNNFWGYFGKREDNTKTEFLDKAHDFYALLEQERKGEIELVTAQLLPGNEFLMVQHKPTKEEPGRKSSLLVAAWTTALARVRLNRVLQAHQDAVQYCDTDSVFLVASAEAPGPDAPGWLGTLKDELEDAYPGLGAWVGRWVCTGPKSYSAIVYDRDGNVLDVVLKMKGVKLASRVALDHEALVRLARGGPSVKVPQTLFKKDVAASSVNVIDVLKSVSFVSNKRVILPNSPSLDTLPYGHQ